MDDVEWRRRGHARPRGLAVAVIRSPDVDRTKPSRDMNFPTHDEAIEPRVSGRAFVVDRSNEVIAHDDFGLELARQSLQSAGHVDGVANDDIVQPLPRANAPTTASP